MTLELDAFYSGILLRESWVNNEAISYMYLSEKSELIVCCVKEQEVTIMDPFSLDIWGIINLNTPQRDLKWNFPFKVIQD